MVLLVGEQLCLVNTNINIVKDAFKLVILTHQLSLQRVRRSSRYIISDSGLRSRVCAVTLLHSYKHSYANYLDYSRPGPAPKGGAHILASGWTASFTISFPPTMFCAAQTVNRFNLTFR